jgi:hypothetical protein
MTKTSSMKLAKCTWFKRVSWEVLYFGAKFLFLIWEFKVFFFLRCTFNFFLTNQEVYIPYNSLIKKVRVHTLHHSPFLRHYGLKFSCLFSFTAHSVFLPRCFPLHWKESNLTSIMNYRTTIVRKKFQNGCCYLESCFHIGLS